MSSKGSPSPRRPTLSDLEAQRTRVQPVEDAQTSEEAYPNYNTTIVRISLPLISTLFLFLLWAISPTKNLGIIAVGTEYIGALRKCSGETCEDWLKGAGGTSASAKTDTPVDPPAPVKRAGSLADAINTSKFFATTGIAILTAFYIALYISICFIIRWFRPPEPPPKDKTEEEVEEKKKGEGWREFRVFAYRASRSLGVILVILLLGCLIACGMAIQSARTKMDLAGSEGIGGGLFLLLLSFFLSLYSSVRDLADPDGKTRRWIGLWCWFPRRFIFRRGPEPGKEKEEDIEMTATAGAGARKGSRDSLSRPTRPPPTHDPRKPVRRDSPAYSNSSSRGRGNRI